jgi:hypothetical protein
MRSVTAPSIDGRRKARIMRNIAWPWTTASGGRIEVRGCAK